MAANPRYGGTIGPGEYAAQGMIGPNEFVAPLSGDLTAISFRFLNSLFQSIKQLESQIGALSYGAWQPVGLVAGVTVTPPGATTPVPLTTSGAVLVRVQGSGLTMQIAGNYTFNPSISATSLIAVLPGGIAPSQTIEFGVAGTTQAQGGAADVASIRIDTSGNITLIPQGNDQVLSISFAQTVPLR